MASQFPWSMPAWSPPRSLVVIKFQAAAPATADTLLSLVKNTDGVDAGGATSIGVTNGKTLRLTGLVISLKAGAAAAAFGSFNLRSNPSGATVIGSPSLLRVELGLTAATVGSAVQSTVPLPDGMEFSGTKTLGVSWTAQATTNVLSIQLIGYEY